MARRRTWIAFLASLVLLAGCGKSDGPGAAGGTAGGTAGTKASAAAAPDELGRLVPADAIGVVYAPSLEGLEKRLNDLVREIQPGAKVDLADAMAGMVGPGVAARIDKTKPVAIALTLASRPSPTGAPDRGPEPMPAFIVPVRPDAPAKTDDGMGGPPVVALGSYVGVSPVPGYAAQATPSPILAGMPRGDVAIRLEIGKAVEKMRPQLDELFSALGGEGGPAGKDEPSQDPKAAMQKALGQIGGILRDFLDSAERLDLGFTIDGGRVDLDATFTAKEGSKLATKLGSGEDPTPLAAMLPREFPLEGAMAIRMDEIMKLVQPLMKEAMKQLGPEAQQAFEAQQDRMIDAYAQLSGATAVGMGFGKAGFESVMVARVKDAKAYREKSEGLIASMAGGPDMGVRFRVQPATKIGDVEVRAWRMDIDFDKLMAASGAPPTAGLDMDSFANSIFGKDGLLVREAVVGDVLVVLYGEDTSLLEKALSAAKGGGKAPAGLAAALSGGGKPTLVFRVEVRELATQMLGMVRTMSPSVAKDVPDVPAGAPLPILVRATSEGRTFRGGVSVDVVGIAKLVKSMAPKKGPR